MVKRALTDLNLHELRDYSFVISVNRCNGSCSTVKDPFGRISVPKRIEKVNLKVSITIKGKN